MESEKAMGVPVIYLTKYVMCKSIVATLLVLTVGMAHGMQLHAMQPQGNPQMLTDNNGVKKYADNEFQAVALKKVLPVDLQNVTLEQGLRTIARKAGLKLVYSSNIIPAHKRVSLKKRTATLENVLWALLADTGLRFGVSSNNHLVIMKWAKEDKKPVSQVQAETVSGTVTDAQTGETLPGVNILVKGTSTGASTDANGQYELEVESLQDTLVVSYVGYKTKEVAINGRNSIDIVLQAQAISGKEITVVGYGTAKTEDISSSQAGISSEDFNKQPVTRVSGALEGKVSGTRVQRTSGKPGSGYVIRIRGSNSINGDNSPLYVVDGLQVSNIDDLPPDDIASLKVLKDASATAVYGSRGSNGVVLITTKSGTPGKMSINFRGSVGFQTVEKRMDLLDGAEFAKLANEQRQATGGGQVFSDDQIANLEKNGGTNWQDLAFRDMAPLQQYNLSFSGGADNGLTYFVSGGYLKQKGIVTDQSYKRYNIRSKINYKYSDKLNFSLDVHGSREGRNGNIMNIRDAIEFDPTLSPVKDENGNYTLSSSYASIAGNPYLNVTKSNRQDYNGRIDSRGTMQYDITNDLSLNILGGVRYFNENNENYEDKIISSKRGHATLSNPRSLRAQNTNRLTFDKDFNKDNQLKADLIFEQQFIRNEGHNINAYDFPTDATGYKKVNISSTVKANSSFTTEKLMSYIGRVNYVWRNKYILTASARADGSSKFRKGHRYGFFPAGSIGWRLKNEKFMESLNFVDKFKLRASYGSTGSQAISPLATRAKLVTGNDINYPLEDDGNLITGIAPSDNLTNRDLSWEITRQGNIGIDMGFLNSRILFTADLYKKETTDLLLNVPLADITGVKEVTRNLGKIQNKGLELNLGLTPVRHEEISFTANFNLSFNSNEVQSLGGREQILTGPHNGPTGGLYPVVLQVGQPLGTFQGYTFEGVYQTDQKEEAAKYGKQPGDAIYKDLNNDGKINGEDVSIIGNGQPDFLYGFNGTLDYKQFDLNLVLVGSYGGKVYNISRGELTGQSSQVLQPVSKVMLDRWTPNNSSNTIPGFTTTTQTYLGASNFIEDGTYLKIKNIALGYTLPENILTKISIASLRIYGSIENLATFTKFKGFDPQLQRDGESDLFRGLYYDFPTYPLSRTISFGIDLKF